MGIARFATLSDGRFYAPLNSFKQHETALRKAQQAMSRKVKFSRNWKKAMPRFSAFTPVSAMLAAISCTKPPTSSAKTTR